MPKISVLIPVYNSESHIERCISSVLNQSLKDIEIIVINDGSFDKSDDIIKKYSEDKRINVINIKNSSYGACLNIGIKEAKGEYITIIESDDFIEKDMLNKLYQGSNFDLVKCGYKSYPDNIEYKLNLSGKYTLDDIPEIINIGSFIRSAIYKRDLLINNNIFFDESKNNFWQDISFYFKTLFLTENIYIIDEALYNYSRNDKSFTSKLIKNPQIIVKEFKYIDEFLINKIILPETYAQLELSRLNNYINTFFAISKIYEKEFIMLSSHDLKATNTKIYYKSANIRLKDKIKMFLYVNYSDVFAMILKIIKKYSQKQQER